MRLGFLGKKKKEPKTGLDFSVREPKTFAAIPHSERESDINVKYALLEGFAYARIKWSMEKRKVIYSVVEPELSGRERQALAGIEAFLTESIDVKLTSLRTEKEAIGYLVGKFEGAWRDTKPSISRTSLSKILYFIYRDFIGLNEIEAVMHDPYIEDISCTGAATPLFIVHRVFGSIETDIKFESEEVLANFIIKLSEKCGRYISYATPLFDGTLPDGSRVQASLAKDVTTRGPTFSIRKVRRNPFSPIDMLELKTSSPEMLAYLWYLVEHGASILICGGASSGKTTLLNALSMFIQRDKKIISIEDTREINIGHKNWIPAVTRTGFGLAEEGGKRYGEVDMFDLLKESFRMKPDYVLVGEIRGEEAYVMFQGIASGHASMGTMHAASVSDVIKRLSTPPIELSPYLIETLDAIVIIANARERGETARRVKSISEIMSIDPETKNAHTVTIFTWIPSEDEFRDSSVQSQALRRMAFDTGTPYSGILKDIAERKKVLEWMKRHRIVQYDEVTEIVNRYYSVREELMKLVRKDMPPNRQEKKGKMQTA